MAIHKLATSNLVERLERLEIASTTTSTAARRGQGPYDPPVIAPTLHTTISEICQKDEAQFNEPMKFPPSLKLPTCELQNFLAKISPVLWTNSPAFSDLVGYNK